MTEPLRGAAWWTTAGVAMLLAVVVGSLVSIGPDVPVPDSDKLAHVLAYGALMYWWGMVHPPRRYLWAIALLGLGALLEAGQALTTTRQGEWMDLLANALGIATGLAALATPARGLLAWLDRKLGDRLDARRS